MCRSSRVRQVLSDASTTQLDWPSTLLARSRSARVLSWSLRYVCSYADKYVSQSWSFVVSGDHWAIPWLCRFSSLDTEQPDEIALRHATMWSTDRPICSLVPRPHPCLCCATQVIWLMVFCWLSTTKKLLNGHETPFLMRGWGLGTRLAKHIHCWIAWAILDTVQIAGLEIIQELHTITAITLQFLLQEQPWNSFSITVSNCFHS